MKICVLQPDYSTSSVDYQNYDPPRNLSSLLPDDEVDHIFLNKLTTYKQLKELKRKNYDVFVNLCEGYLEWEVPSIDVIHSLDLLNLPYTGTSASLYDPTKALMKYVAYCEGVKTPTFILVESLKNIESIPSNLSYPLFVKPAKAGDSLGIDAKSLVHNSTELKQKVSELLNEYDQILVEEYIDGREFTVLVAANPYKEEHGIFTKKNCTVFKPVEFIFPKGNHFKTYQLKTSELHPEANIPCNDPLLEKQLRTAAENIFQSFQGVGYARLDFRVDLKGEIYFLEINFTCSVFYTEGYEGSADYILKNDPLGPAGFLKHIIAEGISRHKKKQKKYLVKGNSIAGYGIYASQDIMAGEVIFRGEEQSHRVVTRRFIEGNWSEREKEDFRRYAYPVSEEVYLLWSEEPSDWAPQNHSCSPNTAYRGLDVYSLRNIAVGEELTLDYSSFLDENMEPFECLCGAPNCRKIITGKISNSITERENKLLF